MCLCISVTLSLCLCFCLSLTHYLSVPDLLTNETLCAAWHLKLESKLSSFLFQLRAGSLQPEVEKDVPSEQNNMALPFLVKKSVFLSLYACLQQTNDFVRCPHFAISLFINVLSMT